jgi:hypothetical protein
MHLRMRGTISGSSTNLLSTTLAANRSAVNKLGRPALPYLIHERLPFVGRSRDRGSQSCDGTE